MSRRTFFGITLFIWVVAWASMMILLRGQIAASSPGDPDNYMRLVQVRDWLDGQAWADLKQHRMNPPFGGDLHWSRIVDLPIALIIVALRPLFGQPIAEVAALVAVPGLLYFCLMLVTAQLLRTVSSAGVALALVALLPFNFLLQAQFMPMRIDHHGWQLLMAAVALLAWTRASHAAAAVGAIACAFWMHVSIEGLPYALLFGLLYLIAYFRAGDKRIHTYFSVLSGSTLLLVVVTRGPSLLFESYCDAISAPYLTALLLAAPIFVGLDRIIKPSGFSSRLIPPVCAGFAGVVAIAIVAPMCLNGPFATLDPLTREIWYQNVREGLPFWKQTGPLAVMALIAPIPGIIVGCVLAYKARHTDRAILLGGIAITSFVAWILGLLVMRTGGVAQLYAIPAMAVAISKLVQSRDLFRPRIGWSFSMAGAFLLSTAVPSFAFGQLVFADSERKTEAVRKNACAAGINGPALRSLGDAVIFASLDRGPHILAQTRLTIIASGYHRNTKAIATVIRGFMSPPDKARETVMATPATYLLFCETEAEVRHYISRAPDGLAAALAKGEVPDWLVPDPRLQQPGARLYRIIH